MAQVLARGTAGIVHRILRAGGRHLGPVAGLAALYAPAGASGLHLEVGAAVVAAVAMAGGTARYLPRIIRELTIRRIVRQVTAKKMGAAEGNKLVGMLTRPDDGHPGSRDRGPQDH